MSDSVSAPLASAVHHLSTGEEHSAFTALAPVTVALQGGLGNQLFQWAFAEALRRRGHHVQFDTLRCRGDRPLSIEPLLDGIAIASRWGAVTRLAIHRLLPQLLNVVSEADLDVRDRGGALKGGRPVYLIGYFQAPAYFGEVADDVRARVSAYLRTMVTDTGRDFIDGAHESNSVAVHVRRGDYVTNPAAAAHHGTLGVDYYTQALRQVRMDPTARVTWFSDDLHWVRDNLAAEGDSLCADEWSTEPGGEIALMASCRTRIIANSSFSWWAGYLGRQPEVGGRVVAPSSWFAQNDKPSDLIPDSWVQQ